MTIEWRWKRFEDLTVDELYRVLELREEVFVVEQKCAYREADGKDPHAWHLMGFVDGRLVAYLRSLPGGTRFAEPSLGRIVTSPSTRGQGHGKVLVREGLARTRALRGPGAVIRISAQAHLRRFYEELGFAVEGDVYLEDGIPHLEMVTKGA